MESYKMWSFVMEIFHLALAKCFQVSSTLWLMSALHSSLWLNKILSGGYFPFYSSFGEYVCYFHFGEIMNNAAMNICVQIFLWTQSEIAGSYGNSMYDVQDTHTHKVTLKKTSKNKNKLTNTPNQCMICMIHLYKGWYHCIMVLKDYEKDLKGKWLPHGDRLN